MTKKQVDGNIISKGYKGSDKKQNNRVSTKLPNMENVNSAFRKKSNNLLFDFKDIFKRN